jgi:hypothetical protein
MSQDVYQFRWTMRGVIGIVKYRTNVRLQLLALIKASYDLKMLQLDLGRGNISDLKKVVEIVYAQKLTQISSHMVKDTPANKF